MRVILTDGSFVPRRCFDTVLMDLLLSCVLADAYMVLFEGIMNGDCCDVCIIQLSDLPSV